MQEVNPSTLAFPGARESLHEVLRRGAQMLLTQAIEAEVAQWIDEHRHVTDDDGRRQVVRNGYLPERKIVTGVGEIAVQQPRVHDRRTPDEREHFSSKLLPPYLRKTKSIEELVPYLYLKGISTGDFQKRSRRSWDRTVPAFQRRRSCGSRASGKTNTTCGRHARWPTRNTPTFGPTASTPTFAWKKIGNASWC